MNILKSIQKTITEGNMLSGFHYRVSVVLSGFALASGIGIFALATYQVLYFLNIDPEYCVKCQENGYISIFILMIIMPFMFYLGLVLFNGAFGLIMYAFNKFTLREVVQFSFLYRYPSHWLD